MADQNDVDLESIIERLLEVRGSRPGKQVQLLETEIRYLCTKAREIFISQPILLELEAPIKVPSHDRQPSSFHTLLTTQPFFDRFVATFTDSTMTFCACSNMADSHPKPIISSWVTTWTEESNP